jgi:hypothetical protein
VISLGDMRLRRLLAEIAASQDDAGGPVVNWLALGNFIRANSLWLCRHSSSIFR